ncbi:hypothetical protein ACIBSW_26435 [Actinoplanes sp. NPDC049668]|uniref:hypothetical protein n=1 Tax=unclassified Actinoplanes TaxID=2626549 RepID=UPI0033A7E06B
MIGAWFATDYDAAPTVLELPAEVAGGREDGVCVVDQVVRGTGIVGRISGDHGAVGLKLRGTGVATRVTVVVHLDELATRWWSDRVRPPRFAPEQPRLVLIRAQGELRGAALLCRPQGLRRAGGAKAEVAFDLTAGELDDDGLLMIELAEPPRPPWVAGRLAARSALGVRIDHISVRAQPHTPAGHGAPDPTGCDLALLAPNPPERFRLEVTAVPPAPPLPRSPSNRWTRRRPARAGFKVLRAARRAGARVVAEVNRSRPGTVRAVHAVDLLTGEPVAVEVVANGPGGTDLRLAGGVEGPVLLGLERPDRGLSCRIVPTP